MDNRRRGMTLLEILVVIALVGLLVALLLPGVQSARSSARRLECLNRMKQVGVALHNFQSNEGAFPARSRNRLSWQVSLLPYLDEDAFFQRFDHDQGVLNIEHNEKLLSEVSIPHYRCPANGSSNWGSGDFMGNSGPGFPAHSGGFFASTNGVKPRDIVDGLSNTAAVSEIVSGKQQQVDLFIANGTESEWLKFVDVCQTSTDELPLGRFLGIGWHGPGLPKSVYNHANSPGGNSCFSRVTRNPQLMTLTPRSLHGSGINLLLADGSVRFTAYSIDLETWRSLGTVSESHSVW